MKVWYLPIEPLEERYSMQMLKWVCADLETLDLECTVLLPDSPQAIAAGQWLDTCGTIDFKARQLQLAAQAFQAGRVRPGDVFLIGDLWFPGLEALRWLSDLNDVPVKIIGWHYAGMFDPHDLLAKKLGTWGDKFERMILQTVANDVCVGSAFHAALLRRAGINARVHALGLAWKPEEVRAYAQPPAQREKIVVFPHRLAPEKNPDVFARVARTLRPEFPDWRFVVSTSRAGPVEAPDGLEVVRHASKDAYYTFLARCSVFYSAALQETFGYALHEAMALGLGVVAPERCCYPEMLFGDRAYLYGSDDPDGVNLLRKQMTRPAPPPLKMTARFADSTKTFLQRSIHA